MQQINVIDAKFQQSLSERCFEEFLEVAASSDANWKWSEYKDSNLGPPGPKPGALPDCATLRIVSF